MGTPAQFLEQESAYRQAARGQGAGGGNRKQMLSDEEFKENLNEAHQTITGLQQKLGSYDPASPEYAETKASLAKAVQARTALFHPDVHPGALHSLASEIGQKLHLIHPDLPAAVAAPQENTSQAAPVEVGGQFLPAAPAAQVRGPGITPNELKAMAHANLLAEAAPAFKPPALTPTEQHAAARVDAGLDPKAAMPKPAVPEKLVPVVGEDGTVTYTPASEAVGQKVPPKGTTNTPKVGTFGDFVLAAFGPHPTGSQTLQARKLWAASGAGTTVGTHDIQVPQKDGSVMLVQVQTSSHKDFGVGASGLPSERQDGPGVSRGAGQENPTASDAATPGMLRKKVRSSGPALSGAGASAPAAPSAPHGAGRVVGGRLTAPQSKAQEGYNAAVALRSFADRTAALPPGESRAAQQQTLVERISKEAANRFQKFEQDLLIKNKGLGNTLISMRNGLTTGELPPDIMRQLVEITHTEEAAQKDALDAAMQPAPGAATTKSGANSSTANDPLGIR